MEANEYVPIYVRKKIFDGLIKEYEKQKREYDKGFK